LGRNYSYEGSTSPFNGIALSSLTIKNTVTSLGPLAFGNCSSLNKVTIEDGTSILTFTGGSSGSLYSTTGCFYNSPINTVYLGRNISFSSTYSGYMYAFRGNAGLKSLTVGSSVNSITDYAFEGCKGLTSVTIPSSVTTIGNYAFSGCSALPSVSIPASVTTIGSNAFASCSGLTSVTISKSATSVAINDGAFNSCSSLSSITIPNTVASLGPLAFGNCSSLNKVTIEDGASILTFTGGSSGSLYSTTGCFYNSPINTVYLGRNISFSSTYSGYMYAFRGNAGLKSLTIGSSVNSITDYTFQGCNGITTITSQNPVPPTAGNYTFDGINKATCTVNVPYGYKCAYISANQWKNFVNIVDGTTTPCPTGIEDVVAEPLKIYPNPVKDEIVIQSDLPIKKVEIYSLTGTLMKSENNFNGKISVSALPQGVYLLKVYTDNGLVVSKIVKK